MAVKKGDLRSVSRAAFVVHTERFDESLAFFRDVLGLELVEEWHKGGHGAVLCLSRAQSSS